MMFGSMKTLKIYRLILFFFIALAGGLCMTAEPASAFRCGTRLVNVGDTSWEVLNKCGPPQQRDTWIEKRIERAYRMPDLDFERPEESRVPVGVVTYITVEEWMYNPGPSQFIRILRFENNRLVRIETGGYGF